LDETLHDATIANEAHKRCMKAQYNKSVKNFVFSEGDLILLYDQECDKLGSGKFQSRWSSTYIFNRVLAKGAHELVDFDGIPCTTPRNRLYVNKYYA